jgi:hypothetical protein
MRKLAALLVASYFLVFSIPMASATVISIGVQPSEITVNAAKTVTMRFWNTPAEADAVFNVSVKDDLKPYIMCDWCGTPFVVKNDTNRLDNPEKKTIIFTNPDKDMNSSIFVNAKPVGANDTSTVVIHPRVEVRVIMLKPTTTTTTTTIVPITTTTIIPATPIPTTTAPQGGGIGNTTSSTTTIITTIPKINKTTTTTIRMINGTNVETTTTTIQAVDSNQPDYKPLLIGALLLVAIVVAVIVVAHRNSPSSEHIPSQMWQETQKV